jgi:hypothetical protein
MNLQSLTHLELWDASIAAFLLVGCVTLAWWTLVYWKHSHQPFFLAGYLYLLAMGIVGNFAGRVLPFAWIACLIIGIIVWLLVFRCLRVYAIPKNERTLFTLTTLFLFIVAVGIPVSLGSLELRQRTIVFSQLSANVAKLQSAKEDSLSTSRAALARISTDSVFLGLLNSKNDAGLASYLQSQLASNTVQYIVLTDSIGNVIARGNEPTRRGDNLFSQTQWSAPLFQKRLSSLSTTGLSEDNKPLAVACIPVADNAYFLFAGTYLYETWLSQVKLKNRGSLALIDGSRLAGSQW